MTGLPAGWTLCAIGDVLEPVETIGKDEENRVIWYVDISSIANKSNRIVAPKRMNLTEAPSRARQKICAGDVLFSTVRPYLRNIAPVEQQFDRQIASFFPTDSAVPAGCRQRPLAGSGRAVDGRAWTTHEHRRRSLGSLVPEERWPLVLQRPAARILPCYANRCRLVSGRTGRRLFRGEGVSRAAGGNPARCRELHRTQLPEGGGRQAPPQAGSRAVLELPDSGDRRSARQRHLPPLLRGARTGGGADHAGGAAGAELSRRGPVHPQWRICNKAER